MRNWAGTVRWSPTRCVEPASLREVVAIMRGASAAGETVRPIGSGHSFTPLAATSDVQLVLDRYRGVVGVDRDAGLATVRAGTELHDLGPALAEHGVAQENLGDVDRQTLAGALATGTHGTGARFGTLATQVEGLRLVTPAGEVRELTAEDDPDELAAARVSLGLLGVITEYTLRVEPAYRLRYHHDRRQLDDVLGQIDDLVERHRHFEFFWFPYSPYVMTKAQDRVEEPPRGRLRRDVSEAVLENSALLAVSELARTFPRLSRTVGRLSGRLVGGVEGVDDSHRVFANRRWARFNEMEYSVPRERLVEVLTELRRLIERRRFPIHFPVEVRFVAADDIWLSPAYGRDSAYVAVHAYRGKPSSAYFRAAEEILAGADGRPHWGKVHSLAPDALARRYPRWEDFLGLRERLDPHGTFLNPYLTRLLGLR